MTDYETKINELINDLMVDMEIIHEKMIEIGVSPTTHNHLTAVELLETPQEFFTLLLLDKEYNTYGNILKELQTIAAPETKDKKRKSRVYFPWNDQNEVDKVCIRVAKGETYEEIAKTYNVTGNVFTKGFQKHLKFNNKRAVRNYGEKLMERTKMLHETMEG